MNISESIKEFFNSNATTYYEQRSLSGGRLFNEFIEMPATKSILSKKTKKGDSLLDIGCGIGSYSNYYGNRGLKVVGIDISEKMIEISKEVCSSMPNVEFVNISFEKFESNNFKFDFIIGSFMLGYFQNLDLAFRKVHSLLCDNGCAVFSMLHPVKLTTKTSNGNCFCLENYFDNSDYVTDLNFDHDNIILKRWSLENIFDSARKNNLMIDLIKEPTPDIPVNQKIVNSEMYYKLPSVIIFRLIKWK